MKRFITLLLVFLTCSYVAYADEILFNDVPWGTNIPNTLEAFSDISFDEPVEWSFSKWEDYLGSSDYSFIDNGVAMSAMIFDDSYKVAGYNVFMVGLGFIYGVDGETVMRNEDDVRLHTAMYFLSVVDSEKAVKDLHDKLTILYGESIEHNEHDGVYMEWQGEMDTGLIMYSQDEIVLLVYGNTNDLLITELENALSVEEEHNVKGITEGL